MLVPGNRDDGKKEQLTDSLMREVADGDRAAFEQLYRITQNSVYCYLLAIVKSHSTAEDRCRIPIFPSASRYNIIFLGKAPGWIFIDC